VNLPPQGAGGKGGTKGKGAQARNRAGDAVRCRGGDAFQSPTHAGSRGSRRVPPKNRRQELARESPVPGRKGP